MVYVRSKDGLFGHGLTLESSTLYGLHANYVFTYIISAFEWISGLFLVALFAIFISRLASIANIVKINYAKLLISAFTTIFIIQISGNILMNLVLGPIVMNGLPFVSYGGSQLIIHAVAIGLILSVYRRRYFTMSNIVN